MTRKIKNAREQNRQQRRLAAQISLGIMAGMTGLFSFMPTGFAMPKLDKVVGGAPNINNDGTTMSITSNNQYNAIDWIDFSVKHGETVEFDNGAKTNDYLNVVTGAATSQIDGAINGGKNVYLINPNGIIFGSGANVNVGALHASTRADVTKEIKDKFVADGTSPIETHAAYAPSDIVNMGTIKADKVVMEGHNIRFVTTNVTSNDVTLTALPAYTNAAGTSENGYIHLGIDMPKTNGVSTYTSSPSTPTGYSKGANSVADIENYMMVYGTQDLQNISTNLAGNYMLANDIGSADAETAFTPIGGSSSNFTGKFDGMFHKISGLNISGAKYVGLFGTLDGTNGGTVENLGLVNIKVSGTGMSSTAGGAGALAGRAREGATIKNVYVTETDAGKTNITGNIAARTGGLIGFVPKANISSSYFNGTTNGGGIAGTVTVSGTEIKDVYTFLDNHSSNTSGIINTTSGNVSIYIKNAYTNASSLGGSAHPAPSEYAGYGSAFTNASTGNVTGVYSSISGGATQNQNYGNTISTYEGVQGGSWSISNTGGLQETSSGALYRPTWRLYEGQSLPLLTAFFKGTVQAEYTAAMGTDSYKNTTNIGTAGTYGGANTATTDFDYTRTGNLSAIYNGNTPTLSDVAFYGANNNDSEITKSYPSSKNAGAYYLFSSAQDGYDVAGDVFTINKREVGVNVTQDMPVSMEYNGTNVGTASDLFSASAGTAKTGIIPADQPYLTVNANGTIKFYTDSGMQTPSADAGKGKYVEITVNAPGQGEDKLKPVTGYESFYNELKDNYDVQITGGNTTSNNGTITPRAITLNTSGLTKVYDGTNKLTNANITSITTDLDARRVEGDTLTFNVDQVANGSVYDSVDAGDTNVTLNNLVLSGDAATLNNYKLVDSAGNVLFYQKDPNNTKAVEENNVTGGTSNVNATILRRYIDPKALIRVTKEYDGTSAVDGSTITIKSGATVNAEDVATTDTGLLRADVDNFNISTASSQDGRIFSTDAAGSIEAVDAYGSGLDNIAQYASVNMNVSGDAAKNYTFDNSVNRTAINTSAPVEVTGAEGIITKRNLNLATTAAAASSIDKVYDGTDVVDHADTYVGYASDSKTLTGNDNVTLAYAGAYQSMDNGNVAAKDVYWVNEEAHEKNIKFTATLTGEKAANYTVNGTNATGKITQRVINVGFVDDKGTGIDKTYNNTSTLTAEDGVAARKEFNANNIVIEATNNTTKTGVVDGETVTLTNVAANYGNVNDGTFTADKNVAYDGNGNVTTKTVRYTYRIAAGEGTNTNINNYETVGYVDGSGTITPKTIDGKIGSTGTVINGVITTVTGLTKTYDGTTALSDDNRTVVSGNNLKAVGMYNGDDVYVTANAASSSYNDANVAGATTVNYAGARLVGANAGNYALNSTKGDGTINQRQINVSLESYDAKTKIYNGDTTVDNPTGISYNSGVNISQSAEGVIAGDNVTVTSDGGSYSSENANYDPRDGETAKNNNNTITYNLIKNGDTNNNYVIYVAATAAAKANNNYTEGTSITTGGNIAKRALSVVADDDALANYGGGVNKIYDGTTSLGTDTAGNNWTQNAGDVPLTNYIKLNTASAGGDTGRVGNDDVSLDYSQITGTYGTLQGNGTIAATKNAGAHDVQFTNFKTTGAAAGNYYIDNAALNARGTITPKTIDGKIGITPDVDGNGMITGVTGLTKVYDGTTALSSDNEAVVNGNNLKAVGMYADDDVYVTADVENIKYDDANVARDTNGNVTAQNVTYGGASLGGANAGNYTLNSTTGDGTITPKTLTAKSIDGNGYAINEAGNLFSKTYNGEDSKIGKNNIKLEGIVDADAGKVGLSGDVTNDAATMKDAGNYTVSYGGVELSGTSASNYTLNKDSLAKNVTIYKAPLTLEITGQVHKVYDGNADVNVNTDGAVKLTENDVTLSGWVKDEDEVAMNDDGVAAIIGKYSDANVNTNVTNGTAGQYQNIAGKTYGYKEVTYTGIDEVLAALNDARTNNYEITSVAGAETREEGTPSTLTREGTSLAKTVYFNEAAQKGYIKPYALAVTATWDTTIEKTYDGTATAPGAQTNKTGDVYTSVAGSDKLSFTTTLPGNNTPTSLAYTYTSAQYDSKNVADANTVTYNDVMITPDSLGDNYDFGPTSYGNLWQQNGGGHTVRINKRTVNLVLPNSIEKTYDGTADVSGADKAGFLYEHVTAAEAATHAQETGFIVEDAANANITYTNIAFADADAKYDIDGNSLGNGANNINYTATLSGTDKGNYVLTNGTMTGDSITGTIAGKIKQRIVYVELTPETTDRTGSIEKPYDGTATADKTKNVTYLTTAAADSTSGIVNNDAVAVNIANATAKYVDSSGNPDANVARDASGQVIAKDVYYSSFNFTGASDANKSKNYIIKTKGIGANSEGTALTGTGYGKITPINVKVSINGIPISKEYDGTSDLVDERHGNDYSTINQINATSDDAAITRNDGAGAYQTIIDGNVVDVLRVDAANSYFVDANGNEAKDVEKALGVTYTLKYNQNFELVKMSTAGTEKITPTEVSTQTLTARLRGDGSITPRTLNVTDIGGVSKVYNGTSNVNGSVSFVFNDAVATADNLKFTTTGGKYYDSTGTNEVTDVGDDYRVKELSITNTNSNYQLVDANGDAITEPYSLTTGANSKITPAPLYINVSGQTISTGQAIPYTTTGSVTGWVNGESEADYAENYGGLNLSYVFDDPNNTVANTGAAGTYADVYWGYRDGAKVANGDGTVAAYGNYYFTQMPGSLTIVSRNNGGGGGYNPTPTPTPDPAPNPNPNPTPVTPTPVTPVTPVTPTSSTPTNPTSPIIPSNGGGNIVDVVNNILNGGSGSGSGTTVSVVSEYTQTVGEASRFVPDANSYPNASYDNDESHYTHVSDIDLVSEGLGINLGDDSTYTHESEIGIETRGYSTLTANDVTVDGSTIFIGSTSGGTTTNIGNAVTRETREYETEDYAVDAERTVREAAIAIESSGETTNLTGEAANFNSEMATLNGETATLNGETASDIGAAVGGTESASAESTDIAASEGESLLSRYLKKDAASESESESSSSSYETRNQTSTGGIMINSKDEDKDEDEEERQRKLNRAARLATQIGIETLGEGVNLAAYR